MTHNEIYARLKERFDKLESIPLEFSLLVEAYKLGQENVTRYKGPTTEEFVAATSVTPATAKKRRARKNTKMASATRERWAVVKEAGLDSGGKAPSKELVAKARRILARKGKKA